MAYASACDVFGLVRSLVLPSASFDTTTCPTYDDVTRWLSAGSAAIDVQLANEGYGPIPTTSPAYGLAQQCNALFAAWFAERSRTNARVSADERTRADMFKRDYDSLMAVLVSQDLSRAGVTYVGGAPYAGGISRSDKATIESDSNRVRPRFSRGMFANRNTLLPTDTSAS